MKNYKDLEIHQLSLDLFYKVHALSLTLPKYELYELGSQIRRSANSVGSNIVEGYGRRQYKADFVRFLNMAYASCLETQLHLEKILHLYPKQGDQFNPLYKEYDKLGAKIYRFIGYVEKNWKS